MDFHYDLHRLHVMDDNGENVEQHKLGVAPHTTGASEVTVFACDIENNP